MTTDLSSPPPDADPRLSVEPALGPPPPNLRSFPAATLIAGRVIVRSHSGGNGPWWFTSAEPDKGGRFDLSSPQGTCYVADDVETAVRERLRELIVRSGIVTPALADAFRVSIMTCSRDWRCAHIGVRSAVRFGVTRELATVPPGMYFLSRQWSQALAQVGHEGIRYGARFTPGPANAWALFGRAGGKEVPAPTILNVISGKQACREAGLKVVPIPRLSSLHVIA